MLTEADSVWWSSALLLFPAGVWQRRHCTMACPALMLDTTNIFVFCLILSEYQAGLFSSWYWQLSWIIPKVCWCLYLSYQGASCLFSVGFWVPLNLGRECKKAYFILNNSLAFLLTSYCDLIKGGEKEKLNSWWPYTNASSYESPIYKQGIGMYLYFSYSW